MTTYVGTGQHAAQLQANQLQAWHNNHRDARADEKAEESRSRAKIGRSLQELIDQLHRVGLFVVPVGELECWLAEEGIQVSKQTKWAWANEAAALIRAMPAKQDNVWGFMRKCADYLEARYVQLSRDT